MIEKVVQIVLLSVFTVGFSFFVWWLTAIIPTFIGQIPQVKDRAALILAAGWTVGLIWGLYKLWNTDNQSFEDWAIGLAMGLLFLVPAWLLSVWGWWQTYKETERR